MCSTQTESASLSAINALPSIQMEDVSLASRDTLSKTVHVSFPQLASVSLATSDALPGTGIIKSALLALKTMSSTPTDAVSLFPINAPPATPLTAAVSPASKATT